MPNVFFSKDLQFNLQYLQNKFINCSDIKFRAFNIKKQNGYLIFSNIMVDKTALNNLVIKSLFHLETSIENNTLSPYKLMDYIPINEISIIEDIDVSIEEILDGKVLIIINGYKNALLVDLSEQAHIEITPPEVEPSVLGTNESFNEDLGVNCTLIRKRIKHKDLKFENTVIGKYSRTKISISYIESITNLKLLEEVKRRLSTIDTASILDTTQILEFIEDSPLSPLPTMKLSEKPDKATAALLEGRIVIIVANSPFVLIAPYLFFDYFAASEDSYDSIYISTFRKFIRYIGYFTSIFLAPLYIAITSFNQELLQTRLLITIAKQRQDVPFPIVVELMIMITAFETIKESSTRLPRGIGSAVSIVGALIIGEAVVTAGLISALVVIITALTATTSVITSCVQLNQSITVFRLFSFFMASLFGFWGIFISIIIIISHLVSLRSLGIPYMSPIAPLVSEDLDDILYRAPVWSNKERPRLFSQKNKIRVKRG